MSVDESVVSVDSGVCAAALPVLVRHVNSARAQTAYAVTALDAHLKNVQQQLGVLEASAAGSSGGRVHSDAAPQPVPLDALRAEVAECLDHLQFHDRVAQTLGHVTASLSLLAQYLDQRMHADPEAREAARRFTAAMARGCELADPHDAI